MLIERSPEAKQAYLDGVKAGMEMAKQIATRYAINAHRRAADHREHGVHTAMTAALDKMEAGYDIATRISDHAALATDR